MYVRVHVKGLESEEGLRPLPPQHFSWNASSAVTVSHIHIIYAWQLVRRVGTDLAQLLLLSLVVPGQVCAGGPIRAEYYYSGSTLHACIRQWPNRLTGLGRGRMFIYHDPTILFKNQKWIKHFKM